MPFPSLWAIWYAIAIVAAWGQLTTCPVGPVDVNEASNRTMHFRDCHAVPIRINVNAGSNNTSIVLEYCTIAGVVFDALVSAYTNITIDIRSCRFVDTPGVQMSVGVASQVDLRIANATIGGSGGVPALTGPLVMCGTSVVTRWSDVSIALSEVEVPPTMTGMLIAIGGPETTLVRTLVALRNVVVASAVVPGRLVYNMDVATVMVYLTGLVSLLECTIQVTNVTLACNYQALLFAPTSRFYNSSIDVDSVTLNISRTANRDDPRLFCVCGNMTIPSASALALSNQAWSVCVGSLMSGSAMRMTRCQFEYVGNFTVLLIVEVSGQNATVLLSDWRVRWTSWSNMTRTAALSVGSVVGDSASVVVANHVVAIDSVQAMQSNLVDPASWVRVPQSMQGTSPVFSLVQGGHAYVRVSLVTACTVLVTNMSVDASGEGITVLRIGHTAINATIRLVHCHLWLQVLYFATLCAPSGVLDNVSLTVSDSSVRSLGNGNVSILFGPDVTLVHTTAVVERSVYDVACVSGLPLWTSATFFMMVRWGFVTQDSWLVVRDMKTIRIATYATNTTFGIMHIYYRLTNSTAMVLNATDVNFAGEFGTEIFSFLTVAFHTNSTVVLDVVRATVGPNGGFCGFCGVLDGSRIDVSSTTVTIAATVMPPLAVLPIALVLPRPSFGGTVTIVTSRIDVVSLVGAVVAAIFTAASITNTRVIIVNASLNVSCVGGTVSVASCGVATHSSVTIRNIVFATSNPISTSVLGASYAVNTFMSVDNISIDIQTIGNVAAVGFLRFLANVTVILTRMSTTTRTTGLTSSMVARPAMSDALMIKFFPADMAQNASKQELATGMEDVSITIASSYWQVTCVPSGLVAGDCVLLGFHGSQLRTSVTIVDTVAVLKAVAGDFVFSGGPMGGVLIAAAPQYGLGDLVQATSTSDVLLNNISLSLTNVTVQCAPIVASQRIALLTADAFGGNDTWQPHVPQCQGLVFSATGATLEAPVNATLVQVGMRYRSNNTFALRNCRIVFAAAAATSTSFRLMVAHPLFPPDARNCTHTINATLSVSAHGVTVVRASCTDASASHCDHVVVDLSSVAVPMSLPQLHGVVVNDVWSNAIVYLRGWSVAFQGSVGGSPAPQGGRVSMLHGALRLTGNATISGASVFGVEAPCIVASASTAASDGTYVVLDALVWVAVARWLDTSSLVIEAPTVPLLGEACSVVTLSADSWVRSQPPISFEFEGTGCSDDMPQRACGSRVLVDGVSFVFAPPLDDVSAAFMSERPLTILCVAATSPSGAAPLGGNNALLSVLVNGITMRLGSDTNRASDATQWMPSRTNGLVLLRAAQSQGVCVTITGSTLDLQRWTVVVGTEPTEALLIVSPPPWLGQTMSAFPYTSFIATNAVVVPQGKRSMKTTYTVAVRSEAGGTGAGWSIPGTFNAQTPVVQCNVINVRYPLVRADPTAIPQNITPLCDSFTQEATVTATCVGDAAATMTPVHAPLYDAYRYGTTVAITAPSPQLFSIPVGAPGTSLAHLARVSWGSVRSVAGERCEQDGNASANVPLKRNDGPLRCRDAIVVLDVAGYVELSTSYVVDVALSSSVRDCPSGAEGTYLLTLDPVASPTPLAARDAAGAVAAITSLVGGVVVSPGIGFAMARSSLVFQLSLCAFSDSEPMTRYDSPFGWSFGGVDGAFLRGSVLGNCAMVLLMVVLTLLVSLVLHVHRRCAQNKESVGQALRLVSLQSLSARTHCPSNLVIPGSWILQATVASSVALLGARWDGASDVVVGLLGLGAPIGLLIKYYHKILFCLPKSCRGTQMSIPWPPQPTPLSVLDWFMSPNTMWKQLHSAEDPLFKRKYFEIFTQYVPACRWFLIVETVSCVVLGVLQGLRPAEAAGCQRIAYAVLSVCLLSCLLCAWSRPYATRFDESILQFNNVFTAVCAVLLAMPDNEEGALTTLADSIAMVQVYISTALTVLWLLHHLQSVRMFLSSLGGHTVHKGGTLRPTTFGRQTREPSGRTRRAGPEQGGSLAVAPLAESVDGMDPRAFHRHLMALATEARVIRQRLTHMSVAPTSRGGSSDEVNGALAAERIELLVRLICVERLNEQIRAAHGRWQAAS